MQANLLWEPVDAEWLQRRSSKQKTNIDSTNIHRRCRGKIHRSDEGYTQKRWSDEEKMHRKEKVLANCGSVER